MEENTRTDAQIIRADWVHTMSLVLSNDYGTYHAIRGQVLNACRDVDADMPDASEWNYEDASGDACEDAVRIVLGLDDDSSTKGLLLGDFLCIGTDGWRELASHFYDFREESEHKNDDDDAAELDAAVAAADTLSPEALINAAGESRALAEDGE